jgi:hypothetical protein
MNGAQTWPDAGFGGLEVVIVLEVEPVLRLGDTPMTRANAACEKPSSSSVSARNSPG